MKAMCRNLANSRAASSPPVQRRRAKQPGFMQRRRQARCMFRRMAAATGATVSPLSAKVPGSFKLLQQVNNIQESRTSDFATFGLGWVERTYSMGSQRQRMLAKPGILCSRNRPNLRRIWMEPGLSSVLHRTASRYFLILLAPSG